MQRMPCPCNAMPSIFGIFPHPGSTPPLYVNNKTLNLLINWNFANEGIKKAMNWAIEASNYGNRKETPEFSTLAKSPLNHINNKISNIHSIDKLLSILKDAEK